MFGYIAPVLSVLSEEEKQRYRSFYCGVCHALRERHAAVGRRVEVGDAPQLDVEPGALAQDRAVLEQALGDARADGSESQDGDSDRFHASSPVSCVEGRGL